MKIAVMASPRNASEARSSMVRLEVEGHDTIGLKFNQGWRVETKPRLDTLLSGASHVLCVIDEGEAEESWFAFIVGLARGRSMPLALYSLTSGWRPHSWLDDVECFDDLDAAVEYFAAEKKEWTVKEAKRMAKASLLELGISWHAESMAQCIRDGDTKAIELFIDSGFPPDVRDKFGVPALCLAARSKHRSIVELLLDRGADINIQSDDRGYSALMDAVQQGDEHLVEFLLGRGADPDLQSKDGQTALVLAVGCNDGSTVEHLLEYGADPDLADKLGLSARKYAKLFHDSRIDAAFARF